MNQNGWIDKFISISRGDRSRGPPWFRETVSPGRGPDAGDAALLVRSHMGKLNYLTAHVFKAGHLSLTSQMHMVIYGCYQ